MSDTAISGAPTDITAAADSTTNSSIDDMVARSTAELQADLCSLAGQLAAATCRFLVLLGEFDHRDGWGGPGLRSCAQWLSWRCGMSLPAAREQVRVARALRSLPLASAEFAAGRLTYSKVRAITRIARPQTEADLVHLALSTTAGQLDRVVGQYRAADEHRLSRHGKAARAFTWSWQDDGSLTVRGKLTAEEGVLLLTALDAMRHRLDGKPDPVPDDGDCQPADGRRRRSTDAGSDDVDAEAYRSDNADALVALARAGLDAGPLDTSGSDRFEIVVHADVDNFRTDDAADAAPDDAQPMPVRGGSPLAEGRCHLRNGPCIHPATLHRLACDSAFRVIMHGSDGSPRDVSDRRRTVTPQLRRLLEERDGGCRFPACGRRKHLHAHHIRFWSLGGPTDLDNLVLLCGFHHRLLHEHGYQITVTDGVRTFRRPDGSEIEDGPALHDDGRFADLSTNCAIGPDSLTPAWGGEPLDLGYIVGVLMQGLPDRYAA